MQKPDEFELSSNSVQKLSVLVIQLWYNPGWLFFIRPLPSVKSWWDCNMVHVAPTWYKTTQTMSLSLQQSFICRMYITSTNTNQTHCGLFNSRVPGNEDTPRICRYLNQGSQKSCKTLCALLSISCFLLYILLAFKMFGLTCLVIVQYILYASSFNK